MSKSRPEMARPNATGRTGQTFNAPANGNPRTPGAALQIPDFRDLHVSAERIRYFAGLDLGELGNLPTTVEDMAALSIRVENCFDSLLTSTLGRISEDYEDISREAFEHISRELALDFIERYGALSLCSSNILRVLWSAQRLKFAKGPEFLRRVGQRLAVFVASQKGQSPQRNVGIAFTLGKPRFLAELTQLSGELGASSSADPMAKQLLRFVGRADGYEMLRLNLKLLEEFLKCDMENPYLHAKNEVLAERLAQHGTRRLASVNGESITPDWFFYTWVAWMVNKSPKTVRRLIQGAETKLRSRISSYEKTNKR